MKRNIKRIFSIIAILLCVFILASCEFFDDSTQLRFIEFPKSVYSLDELENIDAIKAQIKIGVTKGDGEEKEYTLAELDSKNAKVTGFGFDYTGKHTLTVRFGSTVISYDYRVVAPENIEELSGVSYCNNVFYVGGTEDSEANSNSLKAVINYIQDKYEVEFKDKYLNKQIVIKLGTGTYDGHILIKQFPDYAKEGFTAKSLTRSEALSANKVSLYIMGADNFKSVFNGTIEICGFGKDNGGDPKLSTDELRTTFDGIKFYKPIEDAVAGDEYCINTYHNACNVEIINCQFENVGRLNLGYAQQTQEDSYALGSNFKVGGYLYTGCIKNCTFENTDSGIQGYFQNTLEISDCTFNSTRGGFINSQSSGTAIIKNCVVNSLKYAVRNVYGKIIASDCSFKVNTSTAEGGYVIWYKDMGVNASCEFTDCTFDLTNVSGLAFYSAKNGLHIKLVNTEVPVDKIGSNIVIE